MEKSIKETMEMLEAVHEVAKQAKVALADGKIDAKDIPVVIDLFNKFGVLSQGVIGAGEIPAEVKDLSMEELQTVAGKVLDIVKTLKAA